MASTYHDQPHIEDSPQLEKPAAVDSERSLQLDKVVCRCRCGCTCASSRGTVEAGADGGGHGVVAKHSLTPAADDLGSDAGGSINGEEGLDDHKIEVGDFGMIPVRDIHTALARHKRCTCHCGLIPDGANYPCTAPNSPEASGFLSDDSMIVELSRDERSMSSLVLSAISSGTRSISPGGFVQFMGGPFEFELVQPIARNYFNRTPIVLGHDIEYCLNMEIGTSHGGYCPPELIILR